jgi:hypothetical protein
LSDLRTQSLATLDAFRGEFSSNKRLRWMVYGAALVFLFYVVIVAGDYRRAMVREYRPVKEQLLRLHGISKSLNAADYAERLATEEQTGSSLASWFWKADTAGLAGADFQSWLLQVAREAGLEKTRLTLSDLYLQENLLDPVWKLEAELSAETKHAALARFLVALAGSEHRIVVEQVNFVAARTGNRVSVLLVTYFMLGGAQEALS